MNKRLTRADFRRAFVLIGEIIELGRDPGAWRLHLMNRLTELTGSRAALVGEQFVSAQAPRFVGLLEQGWQPPEREKLFGYLNANGMQRHPLHEPVQKLLHRSFTRRRRDIIPDPIWYSSVTIEVCQACNVDDFIYSRWRLPQQGWAHVLSFYRAWGETPYSPRDRHLVSLVHREMGRLWSRIHFGPLGALPPRLWQTLDLTFSGYSEKEMAEALNLSTHTVHDFTRRLYRHFDVSGRSELLANPACRQILLSPALSPAYYAHDRGLTDGTYPAPPDAP